MLNASPAKPVTIARHTLGTVHCYVFTTMMIVLGAAGLGAAQYSPPIGVPTPPFGINQSHQQYSGQIFAPGGFIYRDAGSGPYSHYINKGGNCSDSNNNYGTLTNPRCSIPPTLPAGSVVEIHGGPYPGLTITSNGTAAAPVYVRGAGATAMPIFNNSLILAGRYLIAEYIQVTPAAVALAGDDVSLRYSRIHTHPSGTGSLVRPQGTRNVVYRNEIDHNGGVDRHGVGPSNTASHVWILENNIHDNSGDGIQFCHGCVPGPSHVYIGRNTIHEDHENAIDIKATAGPVVISENDIYGYWPTSTSNGDAIRVNDEGTQGKIWIIANDIHDSAIGIEPSNNLSQGVYVIANRIWDTPTRAIGFSGRNVNNVIIGNTIYNVGIAIAGASEIRNNIISRAATHIPNGVAACSHNLSWQGGAAVSLGSPCAQTISANPQFVNETAADFRLASTSPAIDAGTVASVYSQYQGLYGISIAYDSLGISQPRGAGWDIGALETGGHPPSAPTDLRISE